jgi:branched-chain amino acid aminotransferase
MDDRFAAGCAWIEGEYVPIGEARIPITDAGFTRSDVTYDVVAVWHGKFFRLDAHLDRFARSWTALRMQPQQSRDEMQSILAECVRRSGLREAYVEMILSRGVPPQGVRDPRLFRNRFYAFAIPYIWIVKPDDQEIGTHLVIAEETARISPRSVDPTVKNFHWGDLTRGLFEAYDRGGQTVVLLDTDGNITEGPGFNIFVVGQGQIITPARGALEGITRRTVMELAEELDLPVEAMLFGSDALRTADEIFLTSTAGGVMPVTTLEGNPVGDGRPGPITTLLRQRYWEAHDEAPWTTPIDYEVPVGAVGQG